MRPDSRRPPKILYQLAVGVFFIISTIGCSNGDCSSHDYISQDCKDYGYFLKGTYWVYQNDSTFTLDSFITISVDTGTHYYPVSTEGCEQGPGFNHYFDYAISLAYSNISDDTLEYYCSTGDVNFSRDGIFEGTYLSTELREHNDSSKWEIIDTLVLNGDTFQTVFESKYVDSTTTYFAENVGVIKIQRFTDISNYEESWSLVRYHVEQ